MAGADKALTAKLVVYSVYYDTMQTKTPSLDQVMLAEQWRAMSVKDRMTWINTKKRDIERMQGGFFWLIEAALDRRWPAKHAELDSSIENLAAHLRFIAEYAKAVRRQE